MMEILDSLTRPSDLVASIPDTNTLVCQACAHHCRLAPGERGRCAMRRNQDGRLMVPYGYTSSLAIDPVEKKPFYHFLPGEKALSFGMLGCNFHCPFCQNWSISQTLRDEQAMVLPRRIGADDIIAAARHSACAMIASTYNEPLITSEWAIDIFQRAADAGLKTCMISNGFAGPEVLTALEPWVDAMNIDLKCYSEKGYRHLGGRLQPVKETIAAVWSMGIWVEVITLVVPGFNDSDKELREISEFIVGISADIPWHVSAYHADYKMRHGPPATPVASLERAVNAGQAAGLRYIYVGNASLSGRGRDTLCPSCGVVLINRQPFFGETTCRVDPQGQCPECGTSIAGIWSPSPESS